MDNESLLSGKSGKSRHSRISELGTRTSSRSTNLGELDGSPNESESRFYPKVPRYGTALVMTAAHPMVGCMRVGYVPPSRAIEAPEEIDPRQVLPQLNCFRMRPPSAFRTYSPRRWISMGGHTRASFFHAKNPFSKDEDSSRFTDARMSLAAHRDKSPSLASRRGARRGIMRAIRPTPRCVTV